MVSFSLHAPAKINLTLEILDRRANGYHGVRSLMLPLDLCDEIIVEPAEAFAFVCDDPSLATDDNLAVRAFTAASPPNRAVRLTLHKRIPSQAGLGGGSSDAASVLLAAARGAFGTAPQRDWLAIARELGSDVPFFLAQTGALVEGTGERVTALGALPSWHVIIVKPARTVSTASAYVAFDAKPRPSRPRNTSPTLHAVEALQRGDFERLKACMQNDFQDVIAREVPDVAIALDALRTAGATNALLAGSGSCVFSLFESRQGRESALASLQLPETYRVISASVAATPNWRA